MEQADIKNWEISKVSFPMNGYDVVFKIGTMHDNTGVLDGLYLYVWGESLDPEKRSFSAHHFDSDFVSIMAVQQAAIDYERGNPGFLEREGSQALEIVAEKVIKAKRKVFSIRFDTEMQTKFAESCKKTGKPQSAVMRKLMENFISGVEA